MPASQRQEVFNVILAQLLQERGVVVAPESIHYTGSQRTRQMPDVIVHFQGLRMAIEGEVEAPDARNKAISSAARRVETGLAHIGIGVVYPAALRAADFEHLKDTLAQARLEIAVATEAGSGGFTTGDVNYLERLLRSTFEQLIKEDVVAEAVALLDAAVDRFAGDVLLTPGNRDRIIIALNGSMTDKELDALSEAERAANCRIGGLVLLNALIFHDVLADTQKVTALSIILKKSTIMDVFLEEWQYILDKVNYYPIFHLALEIFASLSSRTGGLVLRPLVTVAAKISEKRAALRHDLMGRVYHRLLASAKYLGTYYTSIPAATLLLKLALRPEGWATEWDKLPQLEKLRVADLACGTGTLLMAAADTVADNYISATADAGKNVQLKALHKRITESILHGYDVLASAIHLTASTLAMRTPDVPLKKMNLFSLPLGGTDRMLGSLEFLGGNLVQMPLDLFGALPETSSPQQISGMAMEETRYVTLPELDLCVMNPPYVRSVGGNLLFGSVPEADRTRMQTRLKQLVRRSEVQANITAGLGSVFAAIGDRHIKPGGRLALVLPKALLSGVAWGETRQLINKKYRIDYVIVSHDAERWNFSDSTDLSEVLLVATKNAHNGTPKGQYQTTAVNLWRNPTTALEALAVAAQILEGDPPDLVTGQGVAQLRINGYKAGEIVSYSWDEMQRDWFLPCAFAQADLIRSAYHLLNGELKLPGVEQIYSVPLTRLGDLGVLGPDRRDIHDGFELTPSPTVYPAFWGHDAQSMLTIAQKPNQYLSPLPKAKPGRSLRKATDLWPLSGKILLAERMWLRTQRLVAVHLDQPVLSNVWWSFALNGEVNQTEASKALVLWLNSSMALLTLFATRDETRGAWVDFKKPSLAAMPVLDVRKLTDEQRSTLAAAYDRVCEQELKPLPDMANDPVRADIDAAIAATLGLQDFSVLRTLLAREPVVCMKRL